MHNNRNYQCRPTTSTRNNDLDAFQLRIIGAGFPPTAVNPVISPTNSVYAGTPVTIDVTTAPLGIPSYAQCNGSRSCRRVFNVGASTTNIPMPVNTTSFAEALQLPGCDTNLYGSVTSSVVTLTIQPPMLRSLPSFRRYTLALTGDSSKTFQWKRCH